MGIPVHHTEQVIYNLHRLYGPVQLPHLFANWRQVYTEMDLSRVSDCEWCYQPLFVVEKPGQE